jgi:hypothetical protein
VEVGKTNEQGSIPVALGTIKPAFSWRLHYELGVWHEKKEIKETICGASEGGNKELGDAFPREPTIGSFDNHFTSRAQ